MPTNYEWLLHMDGEERQARFDAEHVDYLGHPTDMSQKSADCVRNDGKMSETGVSANAVDANDENATCNKIARIVADDSREQLEADVLNHVGLVTNRDTVFEWLNRQAAITRKTEQAAWIQQANGLIHEANVRADELRDELAKRDKGIARLKRQRDEARQELEKNRWEYCETCEHAEHVDRLEAECDKLKRKEKQLSNELGLRDKAIEMLLDVKQELIAERDNLAADLRDCEQQREHLRQALGTAIDHAHEIVSLVTLDGEVIG